MINSTSIYQFREFFAEQCLIVDSSMDSKINALANILLKPLEIISTYHGSDYVVKKFSISAGVVREIPISNTTKNWVLIACYITFVPAVSSAIYLKMFNHLYNSELCAASRDLIKGYIRRQQHQLIREMYPQNIPASRG